MYSARFISVKTSVSAVCLSQMLQPLKLFPLLKINSLLWAFNATFCVWSIKANRRLAPSYSYSPSPLGSPAPPALCSPASGPGSLAIALREEGPLGFQTPHVLLPCLFCVHIIRECASVCAAGSPLRNVKWITWGLGNQPALPVKPPPPLTPSPIFTGLWCHPYRILMTYASVLLSLSPLRSSIRLTLCFHLGR